MSDTQNLINEAIARYDNASATSDSSIGEIGEQWHVIIGFEYESDLYEIVNTNPDYFTLNRLSDDTVETYALADGTLVEQVADGHDELDFGVYHD